MGNPIIINSNPNPYGDMLKSTYDTDKDGIVDKAEMSLSLLGSDTRSVNSPPSDYMRNGALYYGNPSEICEFKSIATIGASSYLTGSYCYLVTMTPWGDSSGGYPIQIAYGNGSPVYRYGTSATTWGSWNQFVTNTQLSNVVTPSCAYGTITGGYTKVGKVVNYSIRVVLTTTTGITAWNQFITGMPASAVESPSRGLYTSGSFFDYYIVGTTLNFGALPTLAVGGQYCFSGSYISAS